MEDLYARYLQLYALDRSGASHDFSDAVEEAVGDLTETVKRVEILAVAAIAVSEFVNTEISESEYIRHELLNFYEFQQIWERYRNLAPRK